MTTTELAIAQTAPTAIDTANPSAGMYCSMKGNSREERLAVFEAVTNAEALEDHINERLNVCDVVIQPVEFADSVTGELVQQNRIVLVTEEGRAYACVSLGVETAIKQLFGIVGQPHWEPAIALVATKEKAKNGYKFTTLSLYKEKA